MSNPLTKAISSLPDPPASNDPLATIISARLKQRLVEILTNGVPLFDKMTGEPALMPDGSHAHRPPSAAELSVCERLVARAQSAGTLNDHDEVNRILSEMKSRGWSFPEVDTTSDDPTSR